ncbi:NAD(P)-binding protein [Fibrella forsythiae]|uniref:NAD(P)-binding protein n=1 Tax=Fibrella forsythiae TaxID=2817061 RepID=A0ABS3JHI0_9BACT|nr:NAD(P)/FAD-dependent oxidoreductase [Fibrella forsythiae]MBO0949477.1 NAD(P)-binding protein [Fibrella forsythiae]
MNRRRFIQTTALGLTAFTVPPLVPGCTTAGGSDSGTLSTGQNWSNVPGNLLGPNAKAGHWLRQTLAPATAVEPDIYDVVIVGGGISGLSARRWLWQKGVRNTLMLELETQPGGNSGSGKNDVSAFPWGAHYLPVPDARHAELIDFLRETGTITGCTANGTPIYNDYHLCHDPEERLFLDGRWQDGLIPNEGIPDADHQQITRFLALIETLKKAKGADGRDAFAIPLDRSSTDPAYRLLDTITMTEWLDQQGFTSTYLRWYVAYSCKDDYGTTPNQTSAWAGLHYFASRKGVGVDANGATLTSAVLTWPEGNGFLMNQLRQQADSPIRSQTIAYAIDLADPSAVRVSVNNVPTGKQTVIRARKVLLAVPQFVANRLLTTADPTRTATGFHYAPWVVVNLTVNALPQTAGKTLCWDNVLYGTESVGYVSANHQHLTDSPQRVLTIYRPLTGNDPAEVRRRAYHTTREEWLHQTMTELETAHPGLSAHIQQADVWVWGHGMISPTPGFIWGEARQKARQPVQARVYFAHSDLSGISIFEEAFSQGIRAVNAMLTGGGIAT